MSIQINQLTFEQSLERLESIIESMEAGNTALADLVAKFEEGSTLLKSCQSQLNEAELKIDKLNLKSGEVERFEIPSAAE
jgi:exodeoxyribonuclease VII small subunit